MWHVIQNTGKYIYIFICKHGMLKFNLKFGKLFNTIKIWKAIQHKKVWKAIRNIKYEIYSKQKIWKAVQHTQKYVINIVPLHENTRLRFYKHP